MESKNQAICEPEPMFACYYHDTINATEIILDVPAYECPEDEEESLPISLLINGKLNDDNIIPIIRHIIKNIEII